MLNILGKSVSGTFQVWLGEMFLRQEWETLGLGAVASCSLTVTLPFFRVINNQQMLVQGLTDNEDRGLLGTETSFQKCSLNTTEIQSHYSRGGIDIQLNSAQTMESLPFNSRAMDFQEAPLASKLDHEVAGLQQRFNGIHKILIDHSEYQSDLHERRRGYKMMPIDHSSLSKDFSNKVHIISDITSLIDSLGTSSKEELNQLLQTKFQQYYLQRHYGGLTGDIGNLSIQERLDNSSPSSTPSDVNQDDEENIIISKIGNFQSLIPQSKLTYSEEFCQTQDLDQDLYVPVPRIIEVQIPVMIYKIKEKVVNYEESDICSNIDDIITKFSRPYEDIYEHGEKQLFDDLKEDENSGPKTMPQNPVLSHTPSLMSNNQITQIELAYSDFPEEDILKLPLDSYAQIQSLISNTSRPESERDKPRTERQTPVSEGTILITEKIISRSIIEKYQESERALIEENAELKEWIETLRTQIYESEKKQKDLENQNKKLSHQLEEEIQQSQYYSSKLDDLNVDILEEKVQCLTHLNESKQRKIELLNNELADKKLQLSTLNKHIMDIDQQLRASDETLSKKEDEIAVLVKLLEEKELELAEYNSCEENVIKIASQTEISLKEEIEKLEKEKIELHQNIKFFKQRLQNDGLSLQFQEATEIQGIIQQREHHFSLELQEVNKKYDSILSAYQKELTDLKIQLEELKVLNEDKTKQIQSQSTKECQRKLENDQYFKEFQVLIEEYNSELESKDEQILTLKKKSSVELKGPVDVHLFLEKSQRTIEMLQKQLLIERDHKARLTSQLIELDQVIRKDIEEIKVRKNNEDESCLIEELSAELEKKMKENTQLKEQISSQSSQILSLTNSNGSSIIGQLKQENIKLRRTNGKLKRYTVALEEQIRFVCGIDECQSHRNEINRLMQERNFYLNLATQCQTSANPFLC